MDYSPAQSVSSDLSDEELDKYFASYVPLSNLPTPPVAKDSTKPNRAFPSASTCSDPQTHDDVMVPEFRGQYLSLIQHHTHIGWSHAEHGLVLKILVEWPQLAAAFPLHNLSEEADVICPLPFNPLPHISFRSCRSTVSPI